MREIFRQDPLHSPGHATCISGCTRTSLPNVQHRRCTQNQQSARIRCLIMAPKYRAQCRCKDCTSSLWRCYACRCGTKYLLVLGQPRDMTNSDTRNLALAQLRHVLFSQLDTIQDRRLSDETVEALLTICGDSMLLAALDLVDSADGELTASVEWHPDTEHVRSLDHRTTVWQRALSRKAETYWFQYREIDDEAHLRNVSPFSALGLRRPTRSHCNPYTVHVQLLLSRSCI